MLTVGLAIALWLAISCGITFALLPYENAITGNFIVTAIVFFNNLNIFISICEICLGIHILYIKEDYKKKLKVYGERNLNLSGALSWINMPLTLGQVFNGKTWAEMWSTYSLLDPSYQNHESFGFFIDVGNGWTTIPPCLLLNYAMIRPDNVSPLLVGCVSVASYWQMLYGTVIYFLSYLFNRRYLGKTIGVYIVVFVSNVTWMVFPAIAIYAAVCILRDGDLSILQ
mmetsp:Transcript_21516/g.27137  ORF Transcript_21516/g.27137 Transcript_21516/m.27137 type:complete len:227 (+) Transcript_21516:68-748(+)